RMHVTTAVTCPTLRMHPAIVAQAAATSAVLLDGRFTLGVGTGEALNEHILGDRWPRHAERLEMLEEAIGVIRTLWEGGVHSHRAPAMGQRGPAGRARAGAPDAGAVRTGIGAGEPRDGGRGGPLRPRPGGAPERHPPL